MDILRPRWSSATFLLYAGVLTVGISASYALQYLQSQYGDAAYVLWSLLVLAVLLGLALLWQSSHALTAGIFAFVSVAAFAGVLGALWHWFGWSTGGGSAFGGFHLGRLVIVLLTLAYARSLIRRFRHPLLALPVAALSWFFVVDLVSNGGSWSAVVSVFAGFAVLLVAVTLDRGPRRPYAFWVHVVAGLTMGGALVYWWHSGNWRFVFLVFAALAYVRIAAATGRSSWAVLGAVGLLISATHFAVEWTHQSLPFFGGDNAPPKLWVPPLVFAVLGFVYVALGWAVSRREPR
jgi:hypothetical protein